MTMAIRPAGGRFPAKWLPAFGFPLPCPRCEGSGRGRLLVEIEHCPPAGQPSPGLPGKDPKIPAARTEAGALPLVNHLESKARHGHVGDQIHLMIVFVVRDDSGALQKSTNSAMNASRPVARPAKPGNTKGAIPWGHPVFFPAPPAKPRGIGLALRAARRSCLASNSVQVALSSSR
jgi:hypothetical protein